MARRQNIKFDTHRKSFIGMFYRNFGYVCYQQNQSSDQPKVFFVAKMHFIESVWIQEWNLAVYSPPPPLLCIGEKNDHKIRATNPQTKWIIPALRTIAAQSTYIVCINSHAATFWRRFYILHFHESCVAHWIVPNLIVNCSNTWSRVTIYRLLPIISTLNGNYVPFNPCGGVISMLMVGHS